MWAGYHKPSHWPMTPSYCAREIPQNQTVLCHIKVIRIQDSSQRQFTQPFVLYYSKSVVLMADGCSFSFALLYEIGQRGDGAVSFSVMEVHMMQSARAFSDSFACTAPHIGLSISARSASATCVAAWRYRPTIQLCPTSVIVGASWTKTRACFARTTVPWGRLKSCSCISLARFLPAVEAARSHISGMRMRLWLLPSEFLKFSQFCSRRRVPNAQMLQLNSHNVGHASHPISFEIVRAEPGASVVTHKWEKWGGGWRVWCAIRSTQQCFDNLSLPFICSEDIFSSTQLLRCS